MTEASITVNGDVRALDGTPVHTTALDFLRGLGLTGAKEGCAEGECGACSVLVARPEGDGTCWTALNACLVPAAALDGQEVVTAEGLGEPHAMHPVQRELAERGGSQCGYCTPGFVCSMAAEFYRRDRDGFDHHALSGNLCRCTGYRPIVDAAEALDAPSPEDPLAVRRDQAPPPALATTVVDGDGVFVRPVDLAAALTALDEHDDAVVLAGSTDLGVEVNLRGARPAYVVAIDRLPELRGIDVSDETIEVGAALTLSEVEAALAGRVPLLDEVWPQFASRLIRNGATIGGNVGTASPIGDLAPALLALDARLVLASSAGEREVPLAEYFTGYRQTVRSRAELIRAVRLPADQPGIVAFHKIAKRRFDDISSVAVAFAIDVTEGVVTSVRIGLGGVAATPIRALRTELTLAGQPWSAGTVEAAAQVLATEGTPIDDMRASAAYRSAMLGNSIRKLFVSPGFETSPSGSSSTTGGAAAPVVEEERQRRHETPGDGGDLS
jgi:xanthine dehydrogenase small subunit